MASVADGVSSESLRATSVRPLRAGSTRPTRRPPRQQRHREVAVHPLRPRYVGLQAVLEAERPQRPLPVPDKRVERRQERDPVPAAPGLRPARAGVGGGQRGRVRPRGHRRPAARSCDLDRRQPGRRRGRVWRDGLAVPALPCAAVAQPLVVGQVGAGHHPERASGDGRETGEALGIRGVGTQQFRRQHTAPAGRTPGASRPRRAQMTWPVSSSHSTATFVSDQSHQAPPFLAPPSWVAFSGPSARSLARTSSQAFSGTWCQRMPRAANARRRKRVVRPFLDRQHAGGVRPVLEGIRPAGIPVRALDPLPGHGAQPGVGDQLVGPREHADRVQLDRAEPPEHAGQPRRGAPQCRRIPAARSVISRTSSGDRVSCGAGRGGVATSREPSRAFRHYGAARAFRKGVPEPSFLNVPGAGGPACLVPVLEDVGGQREQAAHHG